jgi:hypothetical protein
MQVFLFIPAVRDFSKMVVCDGVVYQRIALYILSPFLEHVAMLRTLWSSCLLFPVQGCDIFDLDLQVTTW